MKLLKSENVQIIEKAEDWKDAIRISTELLEQHGYVEPRYKEEIIANVEKLGPYIILADHVILPHARPEQGVKEAQIGVTLIREPVLFSNGQDGQLFITLAAKDSDSHLEALMGISEIVGDEELVKQVIASENEERLYQYFC